MKAVNINDLRLGDKVGWTFDGVEYEGQVKSTYGEGVEIEPLTPSDWDTLRLYEGDEDEWDVVRL